MISFFKNHSGFYVKNGLDWSRGGSKKTSEREDSPSQSLGWERKWIRILHWSGGRQTGNILEVKPTWAPHSSTLSWKIPWTEEPGGLQSMGSLRVRHDWATSLSLFTFMHWRRKWPPTPVFLPGESQGRGSRVSLWQLHRVGHDWSDLAAAAAAAKPTWHEDELEYFCFLETKRYISRKKVESILLDAAEKPRRLVIERM